jgi:hypothetical protein
VIQPLLKCFQGYIEGGKAFVMRLIMIAKVVAAYGPADRIEW